MVQIIAKACLILLDLDLFHREVFDYFCFGFQCIFLFLYFQVLNDTNAFYGKMFQNSFTFNFVGMI